MSTLMKVVVGAFLVVAVLAGAGVYWFLRDDAPSEVNIKTAVESVEDTSSTTASAGGDTTDTTTTEGIDGTWTVDDDTGEFTYEDATGTFAGFRIKEELRTIGATTAVGRTDAVSGEVTFDDTTLTEASFEVDLTDITTETTRRDDEVQEALETGEFPTATFNLTKPVELGEAATDGDSISVKATGDLTIHGETQPVELAIDAQLVNGTIVLVASTDLTFSNFGVEVPKGGPVVSVDDHGVLEAQILLVR